MSTGGGDDRAPVLRIVRGTPDDVELAALVSVLAARVAGAAAGSELTGRPRSAWADRRRMLRGVAAPGPGAWRRSALP